MAVSIQKHGKRERIWVLLAAGFTYRQIGKALNVSSQTLARVSKDEGFQDFAKWWGTIPGLTLENPASSCADDAPKDSASKPPDLRSLASKTLQAVSRGLDSEDPRTALQAASLFLQNYVGDSTL